MSSNLTYDILIQALIDAIPEIQTAYEEERRGWIGEEYWPHIVFSFVLNPYIASLLESDGDDAELQRIFQFLEAMAISDDDLVQAVLAQSVLEHFSGNVPELLPKARVYMGDATRHLSHVAAVAWGHELPYDDDPPEIKAMVPGPRPPRDN
jgi:hypothetical protein